MINNLNNLINRLAANKRIQELQDLEVTDDVMKEIIDLGCRWSLASRYTSYIAIDGKLQTSLKQSWMMIKSRDVPNTMAFGLDTDASCHAADATRLSNQVSEGFSLADELFDRDCFKLLFSVFVCLFLH